MTKWTKEQLDAINKTGTNIIVSAGAGSGKTAVLTERVIAKLKNGIHINELLILTFTNNAAHEMKTRIKDAIKENYELNDELKLIDSSFITTFDAYVLSLVKKYHYYLSLDKNIYIIDSSIIKEKKKELINNIFENYYKDNDENFIKLVTTFGVKNDKPIKKIILSLDNSLDLLINKEDYLNNYTQNYYSEDNVNYLFNDFENLLIKRINSIKNTLDNLSYEVSNDYFEKIHEVLIPLLNSNNYNEIRNNITIKLPPMRNATEKAKHYKEQINKIIKSTKDLCLYNSDILISDFNNTKEYAAPIINILIKLNKEINLYKIKHNMFEFNDISKMAINLLQKNNNVREEIKNYFKEIMIDEYQDTSDIEETFISLIQNNNVYVVGDIKQSIYRFRNANPNIFKMKYDNYKNNNGGIKIDLNKNFRSRENVLTSINNIFDHIMDDNIGNANYKKEHELIFGNLSFNENGNNSYNNDLEIYNYKKDDYYTNEELEAFIIGNDILKKINNKYLVFDKVLRPCTFKDFSILMDRTTYFDLYKKVFDFLKIPLNVYKDEDILLSDETYLIKNILSFAINIKNNIYDEKTKFYFTSIARSYLFNIDDNTIYNLVINNKIKESIIYDNCKEISTLLNNSSNKDILEKIIYKFNFYEKIISVSEVNHRTIILNNLLTKAEELNDIGTDIYGLNDYLNSLIDDGESIKLPSIINDNDLVTITNIHKSKGLEYRICYYSGLHKEFNMQNIKARVLFSSDYGLILPFYNDGFKQTFVSFLNKEKYIKEEISEKLRLLYVALTRCKEKMIIVTSLDENEYANIDQNGVIDYLDRISFKSFKDILNSLYNYINKYIVNIDNPTISKEYNLKKKIDLAKLFNDESSIIVNELEINNELLTEEHYSKIGNKLITEEEKNNMLYGIKLHYILENLDFINPDLTGLNENEKDIVLSLLNNNLMKNINKAKIYKEYEFINIANDKEKTGIIDLMIVYDNYIDIIDYKLKHTDDKDYFKQLNGYKEYIQNKTGKTINIYLYSLLDKKLINL